MTATRREAPRSASRRWGRLAVIAALALVLAAIVAVVAIVTSGSRRSRQTVISPALLARDRALALGAVNAFSYRGGIWMPAQYTGPAWEKYQTAAAADAVLGLLPGGTVAQRVAAAQTVDAVIANHQLPNGDFDNGTAFSGPASVGGGFWAEAEGLISATLRHSVALARLRTWEQSLARYVTFLTSSHDTDWYSNGNVVLRQAVIILETYQLARSVDDWPHPRTGGRIWRSEGSSSPLPLSEEVAAVRVAHVWRAHGSRRRAVVRRESVQKPRGPDYMR